MVLGRVVEAETIPNLGVGYTEHSGSKWRKGKGSLKPNHGLGLNP
jgi:hypothetical protein